MVERDSDDHVRLVENPVGMISGSTTNSASDGMVKMMLAVTVVDAPQHGGALHEHPSGTAISKPSTSGMSESLRWISVSAQALSRWFNRYRTGQVTPFRCFCQRGPARLRRARRRATVTARIDGHASADGGGQRRVERLAQAAVRREQRPAGGGAVVERRAAAVQRNAGALIHAYGEPSVSG